MTAHASLGLGNARRRGSFHGRVTVSAIDPVIAHMVFVAELHRLGPCHVLPREIRRTRQPQYSCQGKTGQEYSCKQTKPGDKIRAAVKNLGHVCVALWRDLHKGSGPRRIHPQSPSQRLLGSNVTRQSLTILFELQLHASIHLIFIFLHGIHLFRLFRNTRNPGASGFLMLLTPRLIQCFFKKSWIARLGPVWAPWYLREILRARFSAKTTPSRAANLLPAIARWGVVQLVGHLTVNEDGEGSNPSAPANSPPAPRMMVLRARIVLIPIALSNQGLS